MKKLIPLFALLAFFYTTTAQSIKYYVDNSNAIFFKQSNNNTVPYPFVGGFVSPQFSNIDLNGDGTKDLFVFDRGGNKVLTFLYVQGTGNNWAYASKYEAAFPKMQAWALLADYNGDGKEDIFTAADPSKFAQSVSVYKNVSTPTELKFELVTGQLTADQNISGLPKAPLYWIRDDISAIDDVDGDGDLDILTFDASASSITLYGNEAVEKNYSLDSLDFRVFDECWGGFRESFTDRSITLGVPCFGSRYYKKSGAHAGSTMLLLDIDDDGDKDLVLGDVSYDQLTLLYNGKTDFAWPYDSMSRYDSIFPKNTTTAKVYTFPASFYVNTGAATKDLIVAPNITNGGKNVNQIWLYKNSGTNTKPVFSLQKTNFLQDLTIDFGSGVTPRFLDVDGDGDLDLIIAHRGEYTNTLNKADRLTLYRNTGSKTTALFTEDNLSDYLNLIQDSIRDMKPTFGDLNGDGKQDMLIGDADGKLNYYQNNTAGNLSFEPRIPAYMDIDIGFAAVPQIIDLDKDNLLDIVIGKGNGYLAFFKNTGTKTNPQFAKKPTIDTLGKVYVADFYWYYILNDTTGMIEDSIRIYSNSAYAAPLFSDLDGDGDLDLLVGTENGKIWLYKDIVNINDSFVEERNFVADQNTQKLGGIDFGLRAVPEVAKLSDSAKTQNIILLGNFRGGLNFLNTIPDNSNAIRTPQNIEELAVNIYPNPTKGQLTISRNLQQYNGALSLTISDILGRTIYQNTIPQGSSEYTLNLGEQSTGVYFVHLTNGYSYSTVQRVSVIK